MTEQEIIQRLEADAASYRRGREHVAALAAEHNADLHRWVEHRERSQRRWHRVARATIGVAAAVALLAIMAQPQPDGQYLSDPSYRAEALHSLDQARLASR